MALEEPANDAPLRPIARRRVEPLRHFVKRQVWRLLDPGHDQLAVRVDPVRARVAAALVRLEIAALPVARHPSDRRRDANPKTCRGRPTGPACINRIYDATAKIDREGFGHAGWPPSPALMMNHKITPNGIPNDSIAAQSALGKEISEASVEILADTLPTVMGDRARITQLVRHLMDNAVKYNNGQRPMVRMSVERGPGEWVIAIEDNGIGIALEYQDQIFDMFQRLHLRDEYPGAGIGLAIAKRIVEGFGGRIWAESILGVGSTFYFTMPDLPGEQNEERLSIWTGCSRSTQSGSCWLKTIRRTSI